MKKLVLFLCFIWPSSAMAIDETKTVKDVVDAYIGNQPYYLAYVQGAVNTSLAIMDQNNELCFKMANDRQYADEVVDLLLKTESVHEDPRIDHGIYVATKHIFKCS